MKNQLFSKLFELREKEAGLKEKIKQEETKIVPYKDSLKSTMEEISSVQEAIIADMKKENVKTYTYDDKNVTAATRKSLAVVDEEQAMESLLENKDLRKITKLNQKEVKEALTITKLNHTKAKEFAEQLVAIGDEVDGIEVKETEYLMVKDTGWLYENYYKKDFEEKC